MMNFAEWTSSADGQRVDLTVRSPKFRRGLILKVSARFEHDLEIMK